MTTSTHRTDVDQFCSRLPALVGGEAASGQTVVVSRAPAIVDVMGGSCEDCGGLVLQGALDVAVAAGAAPRGDGRIVVGWLNSGGEPTEIATPADAVLKAGPDIAVDVDADTAGLDRRGTRVIHALLRELAGCGAADAVRGGLTVIVQSDWPPDAVVDLDGSLAAAVAEAVCALVSPSMEAMRKAEACRRATIDCGAVSAGRRVPLAALLAEPRSLLLIRGTPQPTQSLLELPDGIAVVALDVEVGRPVKPSRHVDSLVAAAMGHVIIRGLIRAEGRPMDVDGSCLANIAPPEYVERFRNEVPTKITGAAFVQKYGTPDDGGLPIEPARIYKVRSRVEHVIYENRRVHEFATLIARTRRTADVQDLAKAGELMYASHWSYSQRCGIGTLESDQVIGAIRELGPDSGFFGAKSTGFGNGGGIVVLMRDTPAAHAALTGVLADFQARRGRRVRLFQGAASGAARFGVRRLASAPPAPVVA